MYGLPVSNPSCIALLVECFNAFILKLNEEVLRPIIVSLAKWSAKESKRKLVFFQIMNGCLDTLREFFVPMVKIYFEIVAQSLTDCHTNLLSQKSLKRSRVETEVSTDDNQELLVVACSLIEHNYKYDANQFLLNDSFEVLCDPIAALFELIDLDNYENFVHTSLKPLVYEMDERTGDDNMW